MGKIADPKRIVRIAMRIFILLLSFGVLLTSVMGILSIINISSNSDNIEFDQDGALFSIGPEQNYFSTSMNFTNDGYFKFEDFQVALIIRLENKTSGESVTILNETLYQNTIDINTKYPINLTAVDEDFNTETLLQDMGGSWYDPVVSSFMEENSEIDWGNLPVDETIFPYLMYSYDLFYMVKLSSTYNLGLVEFSVGFEGSETFEDLFPGQDYETVRDEKLADFLIE